MSSLMALPSIDDATLATSFGAATLQRGREYASVGRVLQATHGGGFLAGLVQGRARDPYRVTLVPVDVIGGRAGRLTGYCNCPVGIHCKHAAALAIVVVASLSRRHGGAGAAPPTWEQSLAPLLGDDTADHTARERAPIPVGLQFEVVEQSPNRFSGETVPPAIVLRPVVPGARSGWVRTGVSWHDLRPTSWRPRVQAHCDALRELFAAYTAAKNAHGYWSGGAPKVRLDEFGSVVWPLLAHAVQEGVELVPAKLAMGEIRIASSPAEVVCELRRDGDAAYASLVPAATVEGESYPAGEVGWVGEPPHGLTLTLPSDAPGGPALLLAPLAKPLSEKIAELVTGGVPVTIPDADLPRFTRDYYPRLRQSLTIVSPDDSVELPELRPPILTLTVTAEPPQGIRLDWGFLYRAGHNEVRVPLEPGVEPGLRDLGYEQMLVVGLGLPYAEVPPLAHESREIASGLSLPASPAHLAGVDAATFMLQVLPDLQEHPSVEIEIVGTLPEFRWSDAPPLVRVSATETSDDRDWFDLGIEVTVEGEQVPFLDIFEALALGETSIVLPSGTWLEINRPEYAELQRLIEEARTLQDRQSTGLRVTPYQAGLWADLVKLGVVDEQSERWARTIKGLLELEALPAPDPPPGLVAELRPYQREGYHWLSFLHDNGLGGVLADDMGLGKTVQALALVSRAAKADPDGPPFLVVAPTSVVHNWGLEAARFAPGLGTACISQTEAKCGVPLSETVAGARLVVTSYALFRIEFEAYAALGWGGLLLDEAQYVKNHQGKTYQCARRLAAPFKLAMTGTPLENNLMDLWSLLSITAPGLFPSPDSFKEYYRRPIDKGDSELLGQLRRRIRPLMLRRTKEQVAADLPPKQEQVLSVDLSPRHQKIYQTHLQRERQRVLGLIGDMDKNRFVIFRSLTLLRQLSLAPVLVDEKYADVKSSKLDAFAEQLREVVDEGHRALVFSQFTGFLGLVRQRLDADGIGYCYLDGRTRRRSEQIDAFKRGDEPVFLISLKAGGFGLNLTEADYVFVLDPWWNPAVEAQAVDRTHRIGQHKTVMVYRLVAADTIEEKVMELKARKQELFDKVMDDDAMMSAPITADDVRGLFGL